jgi:hypothetical protein
MTPRDLFISRKGGARMRVRVVPMRPRFRGSVRRMRTAGLPSWHIALALKASRAAVDRVLGRAEWWRAA